MNKKHIETLTINGKNLTEFTAEKMYELSSSYQFLNNQKFHQLVEEILLKIEETAKSGEFRLSLQIPNTKEDETRYKKINNFLPCLQYNSWIVDKYELDGEDAKNNYLIIEWGNEVLPY